MDGTYDAEVLSARTMPQEICKIRILESHYIFLIAVTLCREWPARGPAPHRTLHKNHLIEPRDPRSAKTSAAGHHSAPAGIEPPEVAEALWWLDERWSCPPTSDLFLSAPASQPLELRPSAFFHFSSPHEFLVSAPSSPPSMKFRDQGPIRRFHLLPEDQHAPPHPHHFARADPVVPAAYAAQQQQGLGTVITVRIGFFRT